MLGYSKHPCGGNLIQRSVSTVKTLEFADGAVKCILLIFCSFDAATFESLPGISKTSEIKALRLTARAGRF